MKRDPLLYLILGVVMMNNALTLKAHDVATVWVGTPLVIGVTGAVFVLIGYCRAVWK